MRGRRKEEDEEGEGRGRGEDRINGSGEEVRGVVVGCERV